MECDDGGGGCTEYIYTRAVGPSDTALVDDPLGVAGVVTTAGAAGDNAVEVGGLQGPELLVGAVF